MEFPSLLFTITSLKNELSLSTATNVNPLEIGAAGLLATLLLFAPTIATVGILLVIVVIILILLFSFPFILVGVIGISATTVAYGALIQGIYPILPHALVVG